MAGGLQSRGAACRHSSAPVTSTHDPMVRAATPAAPTREPPAMPGGPRTERFVRSRPRWRPRSPWGWRAPAPQTAEPYSLFPPPTHPTPQQRRSPSTLPASNPILVFCERGAQASTARLPPPPNHHHHHSLGPSQITPVRTGRLASARVPERHQKEQRMAPHAKLVGHHLLQVPRDRIQCEPFDKQVPKASGQLVVLLPALAIPRPAFACS